MSTNKPWQIAELLPRFYEKNALSIAGLTEQFKINKFKFGHDPLLVDDSKTPPALSRFNPDDNDIKNVFYEGTLNPAEDIIWANGRLMFRCLMAENTLSEPKQYSQTGLYWDNELVAVSIDLPDWVTPEEGINTHPYINFPISGE
ncbi:hypothetical protein PL84_02515 [Vibrio anguillarum]|uniref:hypothetical protein n=1 Tax=Vibrio anguillarum TaxID=55601 RepID=UPI00097E2D32|nr:hypothetical protein [Vibrio anguillarum]MBT2909450.1 hypothetical protein [Vibrio anguillarum]MBT2942524.1 hypothetical protein [Vibrio anguillarum]MBT2950652.1 hypothetical protein [Vibrio anguillarum]MBT2979661.1 hypothetical protein [Vibrio anguillarum]